jgi:hypothetical protein
MLGLVGCTAATSSTNNTLSLVPSGPYKLRVEISWLTSIRSLYHRLPRLELTRIFERCERVAIYAVQKSMPLRAYIPRMYLKPPFKLNRAVKR